jgi:uncharacterized RDD family membrane protein YckC
MSQEKKEKKSVEENYAGFWIRFLAALIDTLILATTQQVLRVSFKKPLLGIFSSVLSFGYAPFMLYQYQATLGKMALGLKVISKDAKKLQVFQVLLREWIGKFLSAIVLGLGFIWIGLDYQKQAWHDKIANTLVVRKK